MRLCDKHAAYAGRFRVRRCRRVIDDSDAVCYTKLRKIDGGEKLHTATIQTLCISEWAVKT